MIVMRSAAESVCFSRLALKYVLYNFLKRLYTVRKMLSIHVKPQTYENHVTYRVSHPKAGKRV